LSNLDANLREEMRFEIRRLHDEFRITTVYVTHDQAEAMVTSDRIAVMNHGRIEQVDEPFRLYTRPKTRFVASFIGRTNFLEGRRAGETFVFDGFSVPMGALPDGGRDGSTITISVRPGALSLSRLAPALDRVCLEGQIVERVFLGENWDYLFAAREGGLRLRVTAASTNVFEIGGKVWVEFDLTQIAAIRESGAEA
jgi:ABC-type Fe3+/spermidine/putrescine transport system ATPase subunit